MPKPITIVGGGLAGLTLGIALRQREVPVVIHEAGHYPRHRVCGEFISGHGQTVLHELGLMKKIYDAGAREAKTAAFFTVKVAGRNTNLLQPAICISRFDLDSLLVKEFVSLGGDLHEQSRYQKEFGEGVVRATGRRTHPTENGWRWFGLKVHARNVPMTADLEIHLQPQGYAGLCRLSGGEVNICGLFRSRHPVPDLAQNWRNWLQGSPGSVLHDRLAGADFIRESFCAVSGLFLSPQQAVTHPECSVGDAITMIAPVTGNGMSMAFESAHAAVEPLAGYSRGEMGWEETRRTIAKGCDRQFARRLRWSTWLQRIVFNPILANTIVRTVSGCPGFLNMLFTRTR